MSESKPIEHESFGLIHFSRVSATPSVDIFGSSIPHRNFIQMEIHNAELHRSTHRDWVFPRKKLLEIYLSVTQFAEAITSLNQGSGIPCSITFFDGHNIEGAKIKSKRLQFDEDFDKYAKKVASKSSEYYDRIREILAKKHIGKGDRQEILGQLRMLDMQVAENIPFLKKEFTRQMDKTVLEAKNTLDAHVDDKLRSLGLQGFKEELLALVGKPIQENDEG